MLNPAGAAICLTYWAYCGISRNCSVVSVTLTEVIPAVCSSCLALAMSCARCGTSAEVGDPG